MTTPPLHTSTTVLKTFCPLNMAKLMARILTKFIFFFILRFLCYYLKS